MRTWLVFLCTGLLMIGVQSAFGQEFAQPTEVDAQKIHLAIENLQEDLSNFKTNSRNEIENLSDLIINLEKSIDDGRLLAEELKKTTSEQNIRQADLEKSQVRYDEENSDLKEIITATGLQVMELQNAIEQLSALTQINKKLIDANKSVLSKHRSLIELNETQINDVEKYTHTEFSGVNNQISKRTTYSIISLVALAMISAFIFIFLKEKLKANENNVFEEIGKTRDNIDKEYLQLDIKLAELLEKQFEILENTELRPDSEGENVDHSLPLKVAAEIHRMRKRVANMPKDTKGIKPLLKALSRLEDELTQKDYEIFELIGKTYNEGMTVTARFVPDEELGADEQIISKVIKPQVNYCGKIIQVADVEVSIGGE